MRTEWRKEICPDCREDREREILIHHIPASMGTPIGWRRGARSGDHVKIERRTRFTTICACDAAE